MAAPKFTSGERMALYRSLFLLNRSFHFALERLNELALLFSPQDLKDMRGLTQEIQLEINHLLLDRLHSAEQHDWTQFGKVRVALEKHLRGTERRKA